MARRSGFMQALVRASRAVEQAQRARERTERQAQGLRERHLREQQRISAANDKEEARRYVESQVDEARSKTEEVAQLIERMESLLTAALKTGHAIALDSLKERPDVPTFVPGDLAKKGLCPAIDDYLPRPLSTLQRLVPGAKAKHAGETERARERFAADTQAHERAEHARQEKLDEAYAAHQKRVEEARAKVAKQHEEIEAFKAALKQGDPEAVTNYFQLVLEGNEDPEGFPNNTKIAYVKESKQLVVQYDLPSIDAIPEEMSYKYVRAKGEIVAAPRPQNQKRALYGAVVAQLALRTLHQVFKGDNDQVLDTVVLNCHVNEVHKGTGQPIYPCLVTVRTTRDVFSRLDLTRVDPVACLKTLNASVSKSPAELVPVRPVLEFDMVDRRFVEEADVLGTLDKRPNLMELTPTEFESLITNLFQAMGLESRQTQASRDGGVDCVAFDPRPIFGGKVVIQAKRYKNTVGVSAVRDLYGTMQNEGASKGILVATSGYGKAAYEFAEGKPLELLSGTNLLYLLKEHAHMEAKIEVPDDWKDPSPDVEGV